MQRLDARLALLFLLALAISPCMAQEQSSMPQSMDTEPASSAITPAERAILLSLRPLLVQALIKSRSSDQSWQTQQQMQSEQDKQRAIDSAARTKEQQQSAQDLAKASATAQAAQTFLSRLLPLLTDFSGSEDQREAAALVALDSIKAGVKKVEADNSILTIGCVTLGVSTAGLAIYTIGHAVLHWW